MQALDRTGTGPEIVVRIFGIDPAFDRMAGERNVLLAQLEHLAGSGTDLLLDQVDAGDRFRDRVLNLDPGIHFHEIEIALGVDQELDRAHPGIIDMPGQADSGLAHRLAQLGRGKRRGGFFEDFLVAALDRAVALAEMDHMPMLIGEQLNLDMARVFDEAFEVDPVIAKASHGFSPGGLESTRQVLVAQGNAHATSTAAGGGLDHDRITDLAGRLQGIGDIGHDAMGAWNDRYARFDRRLARRRLVAHFFDHDIGRADEFDAALGAHPGERSVFRQKAEARMDRIAAGDRGCRQDGLGIEVAVLGSGRTDAQAFISQLGMQGIPVRFGTNRNGLDAHLPAGPDNRHGDFPAIGNQDFLEHKVQPPITQMMSADTASSSPTVALPVAKPTLPRIRVRVTSRRNRSPGTTWRLNRTLSMPPKKAILPRNASLERMLIAPAWASASTIRTPGMTG